MTGGDRQLSDATRLDEHVISASIVDAVAPISSSPAAATAVKPAVVVGYFGSVAVQNGEPDAGYQLSTGTPALSYSHFILSLSLYHLPLQSLLFQSSIGRASQTFSKVPPPNPY